MITQTAQQLSDDKVNFVAHPNRMSIKNARILGVRLDAADTERIAKFETETCIEGVSLARAALRAALAYYETHGTLTLPLEVVSKSAPGKTTPASGKESGSTDTPPPLRPVDPPSSSFRPARARRRA